MLTPKQQALLKGISKLLGEINDINESLEVFFSVEFFQQEKELENLKKENFREAELAHARQISFHNRSKEKVKELDKKERQLKTLINELERDLLKTFLGLP